jgi:hypothetical protein
MSPFNSKLSRCSCMGHAAVFVGLLFATLFVIQARADSLPVGAPLGAGANLTFIIDENNATEKGETKVPIINGQPRLTLGQVFIPGDASDSLRIQVDNLTNPTIYFLGVTSDNNTDSSPAESEKYVATNPTTGRSVTYIIKSDAEGVPEPGSLTLLVVAGLGVFLGPLLRKFAARA